MAMGLWRRGSDERTSPWKLSLSLDTGGGARQVTISTGVSDRRAAAEVERRVGQLATCVRAGVAPDADLLAWLERIPGKLRTALVKQGLVAPDAAAFGRAVAEHVADYLADCEHHGQSTTHIHNKRAQLQRFLDRTGVRRLADIRRDTVAEFLREIRANGKSARTVNQHQTTIVAFLNWCVERERLGRNPASRLKRLDESGDQRRKRRAATEEELAALLAAAPLNRRTVYLVAAMTGLRRGELGKLVVSDVDLQARTLTVRREVSKNKTQAVVPLHSQVVEVLRKHIPVTAARSDKLFAFLPRIQTFHRDLDAAGIARMDEQGRRLDLHALRTTFATRLLRQGVPTAIAKHLTRHKTAAVLDKHYNATDFKDALGAIGCLPALEMAEAGLTAADEPAVLRFPTAAERAVQNAVAEVPPAAGAVANPRQDAPGAAPVGTPPRLRYTASPDADRRDPAGTDGIKRQKSRKDSDLRAVGAVG